MYVYVRVHCNESFCNMLVTIIVALQSSCNIRTLWKWVVVMIHPGGVSQPGSV